MNIGDKNYSRKLLLLVLALSFGIKALVPVGYMPTSLGDGWPVTICFSGLPQGLHAVLGGSHFHSEDDDDAHWRHCPLEALSAAYAITSEYQPPVFDSRQGFSAAVQFKPSIAAPVFGFRARAPPVSAPKT